MTGALALALLAIYLTTTYDRVRRVSASILHQGTSQVQGPRRSSPRRYG